MDREKERPPPDNTDRDRGLNSSSQVELSKHSETKPGKEHQEFEGICLDSASLEKERLDKDLGSLQGFEDGIEAEKVENVEGDARCVFHLLLQIFQHKYLKWREALRKSQSSTCLDILILGLCHLFPSRVVIS